MKGKEREFNIRSFAPTCQVSVRIGVVRFARVVVTLVALEGDQAFVSLAGALRWTATRTVSRYAAVRPKQCVIGDRVVLATSRPLRRSRVGPGGCHRGSTRKEQQAVRYELHGVTSCPAQLWPGCTASVRMPERKSFRERQRVSRARTKPNYCGRKGRRHCAPGGGGSQPATPILFRTPVLARLSTGMTRINGR